jgi:hypothetical protein
MTDPLRLCKDDAARRASDAPAPGWNGIDGVEPDPADPRRLHVYLLRPLSSQFCAAFHDNPPVTSVTVEGGERVTGLRVVSVAVHRAAPHSSQDDSLIVGVDREGDFSIYTVRLTEPTFPRGGAGHPYPDRFDPYYTQANFSFKADCPSPLDCAPARPCPPAPPPEPVLSYLGRDYAGLRQTLFDRLALVMPDWTERHAPDLGVALVELFAYVGDGLSYFQDAVATEGYLSTARLRTSVRRHVRLIDYPMHEGCNARAWVAVKAAAPGAPPPEQRPPKDGELPWHVKVPPDALFLAGADSLPGGAPLTDDRWQKLPPGTVEAFELLADRGKPPWPKDPRRQPGGASPDPVRLFPAHNEMQFYTWGGQECQLPKGRTAATLKGRLWASLVPPDTGPCPAVPKLDPANDLYLRKGDFLLFEEIRSPVTGARADADLAHRHVVVLTGVEAGRDPVADQDVVNITWDSADALPFTLCLSATCPEDPTEATQQPAATGGQARYCRHQTVSVARGNVLLVDHGQSVRGEPVGPVPKAPSRPLPTCDGEGPVVTPPTTPARFRPALQQGPLTWAQPLPTPEPGTLLTAAQMPAQLPRSADPAVLLVQTKGQESAGSAAGAAASFTTVLGGLLYALSPDPLVWLPRHDLLASGPTDLHFVVEPENDGRTYLRFGDDEHGRAVRVDDTFEARYRVGNGPDGNVGRERINRVATPSERVDPSDATLEPHNPFAAVGGSAPEPLAEVKLLAPRAFRTDLRRAVIPDDYAKLVMTRNPEVQRAAAARRWTGAGDLMDVAVDFLAAVPAAERPTLLGKIQTDLNRFRRIGHSVRVHEAQFVPLEVALDVFLLPTALRGAVAARLGELLGNRPLPGGGLGFFHPDNLTFGQGVAASRLIALAQAVPGVEHVAVTLLRRVGATDAPAAPAFLAVGPLEIVQLDNDPNRAENGRLTINLRGGR